MRGDGGEREATDGGNEFMQPAAPVGFGIEDMVQKAASELHDEAVNEEEDSMESRWARRFRKERNDLVAYLEEIG